MAHSSEISNNGVVKNAVAELCATPSPSTDGVITLPAGGDDHRTRDRITGLLLERGAMTAVELSAELGLSAAGIRRHLDALQTQALVRCEEVSPRGPRGRGRPAKAFSLTKAGRAGFRHAYDDLAGAALRHLAQLGGTQAVEHFAAQQVAALEERCLVAMDGAGNDPLARAEALANALSAQGYAASASAIASGGQLCQHHCPVAQVAAEFPQLCEAETAAIGRLVGSHVQRLATIAHGDGVCTTYIPGTASAQTKRTTTFGGTTA